MVHTSGTNECTQQSMFRNEEASRMVNNRENETNKRPDGSQRRIWEKCQGQGQRRLKTGWKKQNRRAREALRGGGDVKRVDMRQVKKIINSGTGGQRE